MFRGTDSRGTSRIATALVAVAVLAVTVATAPAATATDSPQRLESFQLPSSLVDTSTPGGILADGRTVPKVNVLLPAGYDDHPGQQYPVLWLLHGASGGADNWLGNIAQLAAGFGGIIVMPDGGLFGMYVDWWNNGQRGGPAWATYDLTVLKSAIESRYRILPGRRWHAIGGISMGGQGALREAEMLPGYFGTVATFSAALPDMQSLVTQVGLTLIAGANAAPKGATYDAMFGPANAAYAAGNSPQKLVANLQYTRMYLTSGNGINCGQDPVLSSFLIDMATETGVHAQQGPFANAARAAGADVTAVSTCGVHTFGVWNRAIPKAITWGLFAPVDENPTTWTYRTVATAGTMWNLTFQFTAPPTAVATFTRTGNTLAGAGSGTVQLSGAHGCALSLRLPMTTTLPLACR